MKRDMVSEFLGTFHFVGTGHILPSRIGHVVQIHPRTLIFSRNFKLEHWLLRNRVVCIDESTSGAFFVEKYRVLSNNFRLEQKNAVSSFFVLESPLLNRSVQFWAKSRYVLFSEM